MSYSYIIYKIFSWTANKKDDTPIGNTILTLAAVHFFQLGTILLIIDRLIFPLSFIYDINKTYLFMGALVYFILFYFVLYNKKRWDGYIKKYSNESDKERKRGNFFVILFLIGSILLFFISLPVLFSISRH